MPELHAFILNSMLLTVPGYQNLHALRDLLSSACMQQPHLLAIFEGVGVALKPGAYLLFLWCEAV